MLQTADGSVIGVIGVPIIPRTNAHVNVQLPPSMPNQLITMSQVSSDNDDEVPVVSDINIILNFASKSFMLISTHIWTLNSCDRHEATMDSHLKHSIP